MTLKNWEALGCLELPGANYVGHSLSVSLLKLAKSYRLFPDVKTLLIMNPNLDCPLRQVAELFWEITLYLDAPKLCHLSMTCRYASATTIDHTKQCIQHALTPWFSPAPNLHKYDWFMNLLGLSYGAVYRSVTLFVIMPMFLTHSPNDLDIIVPCGQHLAWCWFLEDKGYRLTGSICLYNKPVCCWRVVCFTWVSLELTLFGLFQLFVECLDFPLEMSI